MRSLSCRLAIVVGVLFMATWAAAAEPEPAPPADHAAWAGAWELDKEKSDPPDPMLEVMEVPWYLKALAKTFTPVLHMSVDGPGLELETKTPLGDRTQALRVDGVEYPGSDQLDRKFDQKSTWGPDGHLIVDRLTVLPSGKKARVKSDWQLSDATLTNDMTVRVGEAAPFQLRRVFVRDPDAD